MPAQNPWRRLLRFLDRKSWSLSDPDLACEVFGVSPSNLGVPVSPESAMRVAAFGAAVRLISEAAGTTPAKVFSRDPKAPASDQPAYGFVHDFANEWTSAGTLREEVTADAMLHGHGYARAIRVNGNVQELHRIDQRCHPVQRRCDKLTGEPFYIVGTGADEITVPYTDMVHIAGFRDMPAILTGREAIALSAFLESKVETFVSKNTRPSGIVFFDKAMGRQKKVGDQTITESAIPTLRTAWRDALASSDDGTLFIDGATGANYVPVPTPSAQASELTAQRQFQIDEIARVTGVPPTMLFGLDRATWANVEQLAMQFKQFALRPWLRRWEDAYSIVLLSPEQRKDFYVEFILDDLASADQATQAEAFAKYRAAGAMTANEVRAVRNLPALPDGNTLASPYTTSNTQTP